MSLSKQTDTEVHLVHKSLHAILYYFKSVSV
jgi:hypothetical protein